MHHHQYSERQTSARLIIAAALLLLLLQLLPALLPVTECIRVAAAETEGVGDSQLDAIYFSVLMSEGMSVNSRAELLEKALDGVQVRTKRLGILNAEIEQQLARLLSLIYETMVKLPLSSKSRTAMYERLITIIKPLLTEEAGR